MLSDDGTLSLEASGPRLVWQTLHEVCLCRSCKDGFHPVSLSAKVLEPHLTIIGYVRLLTDATSARYAAGAAPVSKRASL